MIGMREMADVRGLDPAELAGVAGGDDDCGTIGPGLPIPRPSSSMSIASVVHVLPPGPAIGGIGFGFQERQDIRPGNRARGSVAAPPDTAAGPGLGFPDATIGSAIVVPGIRSTLI
jgi:hypothetical protein